MYLMWFFISFMMVMQLLKFVFHWMIMVEFLIQFMKVVGSLDSKEFYMMLVISLIVSHN